jgi:hypothetical protein
MMLLHTVQNWKQNEYGYCCVLVCSRGNDSVGRDPKTVATYLRLQASDAFRTADQIDGSQPAVWDEATLYEMAARLGAAATAINEDARNNYAPDWRRALAVLDVLDGFQWQGDAA